MLGRWILLGLVALVGGVAVAAGSAGILLGPVLGPDTQPVDRDVDSEYRFLSGIWLSWGVAMWWSLRRPSARVVVTRVLLLTAVAGGLARVASALVVGWPSPQLRAAMAVELVLIPVLVAWHAGAMRTAGARTVDGP